MQVGQARSAAPWLSERHSQETKRSPSRVCLGFLLFVLEES